MHQKKVYDRLKTVMDPELNVDIVSLGLIYGVEVIASTKNKNLELRKPFAKIKITMTLTTPACPLAPVIDQMIRDSMFDLVDDTDSDVVINLTFDPPWVTDMMSEEVKLELGF